MLRCFDEFILLVLIFVSWMLRCLTSIICKCRTISLSEYTFNQFWKHFYLFSSVFTCDFCFVLSFSIHRSQSIGCKGLFFFLSLLLLICSRSLLYAVVFHPFHFMFICHRVALFFFGISVCVLLSGKTAISIRSW